MITTSLLLEWHEHPVSKKLIKRLKEEIDHKLASLANGATLGDRCEQKTARYVGEINGLYLALNLDLKEEEEDGKST